MLTPTFAKARILAISIIEYSSGKGVCLHSRTFLQSLITALHLRPTVMTIHSHTHHLTALHSLHVDRGPSVVLFTINVPLNH
jgi:hypothetical protein